MLDLDLQRIGSEVLEEMKKPAKKPKIVAAPQPAHSDEQVACHKAQERAGIGSPGYEKLVAHMQRFGPDGVVESAVGLPEEQIDKLTHMAKRMKYDRARKKWELS
jgi:hypothetical protein